MVSKVNRVTGVMVGRVKVCATVTTRVIQSVFLKKGHLQFSNSTLSCATDITLNNMI